MSSTADLRESVAAYGGGEIRAADLLSRAEAAVGDDVSDTAWHAYLEATGRPEFLQSLEPEERERWAETTFEAIGRSAYSLETMFAARVREIPEKPLFQEPGPGGLARWSYRQVLRRTRSFAAVFLGEVGSAVPRVALLVENSVDGACCDLACLFHDIFVSPLNVHFDDESLVWVLDRARIDTIVVDTPDRARRVAALAGRVGRDRRVLSFGPVTGAEGVERLDEAVANLEPDEVAARLEARPRRDIHDLATVMFTSGSTGRPKGVAFSIYNLVTKRFARAAALPTVGRDEVLLCYLPLFHTFGRYLEMLGTIYWRGSFVFVGNPSAETLLALLMEIRPTGLISIPLRWVQIRERGLAGEAEGRSDGEAFRSVVGDRLRWGLSAAGFLDPRVFRYFQRHGMELCSGFGMTEGTGGITMTPPGAYVDGSVGVRLPGIRTRLSEEGELLIAGPYVARYLADDPAEDPSDDGQTGPIEWLATGDLFRERENGHLEIVDRLKDIYKSSKGQTIAPRRVESRFEGVPGIRRTFLVGDRRPYNTLLVVPDLEDPVLTKLPDEEAVTDYFERIVTAANSDLAASERVVAFALLERDLDLDRGELTPKGSYRRKNIVANFAETVAGLYGKRVAERTVGALTVRIPRWFLRDIGVLGADISVVRSGLRDRASGRTLAIAPGSCEGRVRVGDLEYRVGSDVIDLGLFARQPALWIGNPALAAFAPCREGWDTALGAVSEQVFLPSREGPAEVTDESPRVSDPGLKEVGVLCRRALFGGGQDAIAAVRALVSHLADAGERQERVIQHRLEALAGHPEVRVRSLAYRVLLLDQPAPDYSRHLPAFLESGKTFLTEESITAIASGHIEPRRLQALRKRLHGYRTGLEWPASDSTRRLLVDLFRLLADFARHEPTFYATIRDEFVCWVLHEADPDLAHEAEGLFYSLADWFEGRLEERATGLDPAAWEGRIAYQEGLAPAEIERLDSVLVGTTFLEQSVHLATGGERLDLADVPAGGIWVSRILSTLPYSRYRVSVNTKSGLHYDLQFILREDRDREWVLETVLWFLAIRGHTLGSPVLPRFGCYRPELGAISLSHVSDLTVWERIRELAGQRGQDRSGPTPAVWRRMFVAGMGAIIRAWHNSGRRILPGTLGPTNVVVREPDIREGHLVLSLTGWARYEGPLSLVRPLLKNFVHQTRSHFPWFRDRLEDTWVLDAFVEVLDRDEAIAFLEELRDEIKSQPTDEVTLGVSDYLERLRGRYYRPLPLRLAIRRYRQWVELNPSATPDARLDLLGEVQRMYRLDRLPDIARYTLFRHTTLEAAPPAIVEAAERILSRLFRDPHRPATRMVELSDLQAVLGSPEDRRAFRRIAFPRIEPSRDVEVLTVGDREHGQVIVRTAIEDRRSVTYAVTEPTHASEVGQVYRLFLLAGFPKTISEKDRYLVLTDRNERIVGGVCFQVLGDGEVHLDGTVVVRSLLGRGITSALLEDFCARMADQGHHLVKTHFLLRRFYLKRGFRTDHRHGGLVRDLVPAGERPEVP